jgi:hypothetical protein
MAMKMTGTDYRGLESIMVSIQQLWDCFRLAQQEQNADAALCFRYAIDAYNRCDHDSVQFWYRQAEMCECAVAAGVFN